VIITGDTAGSEEPVAFTDVKAPTWRVFEAVAGQVITSGSERGLRPRIVFDHLGEKSRRRALHLSTFDSSG